MNESNPQPKMVNAFAGAGPRCIRGFVVIALCLWAGLVVADWGFRFGWFHWQERWLLQAAQRDTAAGAAVVAEAKEIHIPERWGNGLTQMVPLRHVAKRYEEFHPAFTFWRDVNGYPNPDYAPDAMYDVALIGDSFTISLGTQDLAQVYAHLSGDRVYHHGRAAAGPLRPMGQFLWRQPLNHMPPVILWMLSARDLDGSLFSRQPITDWLKGVPGTKESTAGQKGVTIQWSALAPREVDRAWPNTSMTALLARKGWSAFCLGVLGIWPADVVGGEDAQFGPILFYRENIRALAARTPEQHTPGIRSAARRLSKGFAERGSHLVVVLIPEKEQLYFDALPPADRAQMLSNGDNFFAMLEAGLKADGVTVVNLMPVFRQATAAGTRLYWRDDTHWNDAGIRLAAETILRARQNRWGE